MIEIQPSQSSQYINYQTHSKRTTTDYIIRSTVDAERLDLVSTDLSSLPPIRLQVTYNAARSVEFSVRYLLFERSLQSYEEEPIAAPAPGSFDIPFSVLPTEVVQRALQFSASGIFPFSVIVEEQIDIAELTGSGLFERQVSPGEEDGSEVIFLLNRTRTDLGDVPIQEYSERVGDLRTEIIWRVTVQGTGNPQCHLEIDDLRQPFGLSDYRERIRLAMSTFGGTVLDRIPSYFAEHFQSTIGLALPVKVIIHELSVDSPIRIHLARRAPEMECFYPTGDPVLDSLIRSVHAELIKRGFPVNPGDCQYQKVLNQFLKYRQALLTTDPRAKFADPKILRESERKFHNHLYLRLTANLDMGAPTYEGTLGNSRIDLLISGIPTELKVERRPDVRTEDIIRTYCDQAADYVARCSSRFGFLLVLDAVQGRLTPTAPADHDLFIVDVPTASGNSVAIIGIVMRLPEPPSLLSKAKTKLKSVVTRIKSL